jgi:hypothetical protein
VFARAFAEDLVNTALRVAFDGAVSFERMPSSS